MPVFEKELSKTDVEVRLHVPTNSLPAFPMAEGAHQFEFDAIDTNGKTWQFKLSTRTKGDYGKPVLTTGWLAFSREKSLQVNDKIILSFNEEVNGAMFRIQALRNLPTKIFGSDIWVNVEDLHRHGY